MLYINNIYIYINNIYFNFILSLNNFLISDHACKLVNKLITNFVISKYLLIVFLISLLLGSMDLLPKCVVSLILKLFICPLVSFVL